MRVALAVVLGLLFGATGNVVARATLDPFIDSAAAVLSWQASALVAQIPWMSAAAVTAVAALLAVVALPVLLACIAEALRGGRSARTSATLTLAVTGLLGLAAPWCAPGPYLAVALFLAAVMALVPSRWAGIPVGFLCAAVTATWIIDLRDSARWVRPAAVALADVTSTAGLWVGALGAAGAGILVCATVLALRSSAGARPSS